MSNNNLSFRAERDYIIVGTMLGGTRVQVDNALEGLGDLVQSLADLVAPAVIRAVVTKVLEGEEELGEPADSTSWLPDAPEPEPEPKPKPKPRGGKK